MIPPFSTNHFLSHALKPLLDYHTIHPFNINHLLSCTLPPYHHHIHHPSNLIHNPLINFCTISYTHLVDGVSAYWLWMRVKGGCRLWWYGQPSPILYPTLPSPPPTSTLYPHPQPICTTSIKYTKSSTPLCTTTIIDFHLRALV